MIIAIAVLVAVVVVYVFVVRPYIREIPWCDPFFDWIEPIEAALWAKSKTVFAARLVTGAGLLLSIHDFVLPVLLAVDLQPFVPSRYQPLYPVALAAIGPIFEWLRRVTSEPLAAKE